jgi:hypothetical protein
VEGRGRALVDVLSRNLHGGTGDNHDGAEIHAGYLPENQFQTIPLEPACFAKYECSNERVSKNVNGGPSLFYGRISGSARNSSHKKPYLGQLLVRKRTEPGRSQIKLRSYHYTALLGTKNGGGKA